MTKQTKEKLRNSRLYNRMKQVTRLTDDYCLDGLIGLVPGGFGDMIAGLFSMVHVYFGLFKLRSIPLTLALLNNMLRDILLGLLPFYVGDLIDFFHKANKKNFRLIDGFVNDDANIVHEVNRKAVQAAIIFFLLIVCIFAMLWLLVWIAEKIGTFLFT